MVRPTPTAQTSSQPEESPTKNAKQKPKPPERTTSQKSSPQKTKGGPSKSSSSFGFFNSASPPATNVNINTESHYYTLPRSGTKQQSDTDEQSNKIETTKKLMTTAGSTDSCLSTVDNDGDSGSGNKHKWRGMKLFKQSGSTSKKPVATIVLGSNSSSTEDVKNSGGSNHSGFLKNLFGRSKKQTVSNINEENCVKNGGKGNDSVQWLNKDGKKEKEIESKDPSGSHSAKITSV